MEATIKIQKLKINQINPAAYNPRIELKPSDPEYQKLKASIESFGYVDPIVWNCQTQNLVGGHQRLRVLIAQGVTEVDASVVDLPLDREKALNIALNKIHGDWDEDKLYEVLTHLSEIPDFDTTLTGFGEDEKSAFFDRRRDEAEDDYDAEADMESTEEPITKKGDLLILGRHRLLCGDSASADDVTRLMDGHQINLVHTDPPYGVSYYGGNRPHADARPKACKHWSVVYQDNLTQPDYEKMLKGVFENMTTHLAPGSAWYIWNGHRQFGPMHQMLTEMGHRVSCVIVWSKPSFSISFGDYHQQIEFCLYGWKEDNGAHYWAGPANESTLWEVNRDPAKELVHPTQKPLALAQRAIRNSSKIGDIVADFFGGSGSTLISAESLDRRAFLMEAEPKHCDSITRRFIRFAGKDKVSDDIFRRYAKPEESK